jgi:uncharacterized membrane protein YqjE
MQIKRIHEYKRQYMNVLSIIHRYKQLKKMTPEERKKVVPRVCMIGGKAASGAATGQGSLACTISLRVDVTYRYESAPAECCCLVRAWVLAINAVAG